MRPGGSEQRGTDRGDSRCPVRRWLNRREATRPQTGAAAHWRAAQGGASQEHTRSDDAQTTRRAGSPSPLAAAESQRVSKAWECPERPWQRCSPNNLDRASGHRVSFCLGSRTIPPSVQSPNRTLVTARSLWAEPRHHRPGPYATQIARQQTRQIQRFGSERTRTIKPRRPRLAQWRRWPHRFQDI